MDTKLNVVFTSSKLGAPSSGKMEALWIDAWMIHEDPL